MSGPTKEEIEKAIDGPGNLYEAHETMIDAYREAVGCLQEILWSEPKLNDIRIPYHTIQVDKRNWDEAEKIIDKCPEE